MILFQPNGTTGNPILDFMIAFTRFSALFLALYTALSQFNLLHCLCCLSPVRNLWSSSASNWYLVMSLSRNSPLCRHLLFPSFNLVVRSAESFCVFISSRSLWLVFCFKSTTYIFNDLFIYSTNQFTLNES